MPRNNFIQTLGKVFVRRRTWNAVVLQVGFASMPNNGTISSPPFLVHDYNELILSAIWLSFAGTVTAPTLTLQILDATTQVWLNHESGAQTLVAGTNFTKSFTNFGDVCRVSVANTASSMSAGTLNIAVKAKG